MESDPLKIDRIGVFDEIAHFNSGKPILLGVHIIIFNISVIFISIIFADGRIAFGGGHLCIGSAAFIGIGDPNRCNIAAADIDIPVAVFGTVDLYGIRNIFFKYCINIDSGLCNIAGGISTYCRDLAGRVVKISGNLVSGTAFVDQLYNAVVCIAEAGNTAGIDVEIDRANSALCCFSAFIDGPDRLVERILRIAAVQGIPFSIDRISVCDRTPADPGSRCS